MLWVNGYVEVRTLYIQAEHEVLRPDDGLDHAKILVGRVRDVSMIAGVWQKLRAYNQ